MSLFHFCENAIIMDRQIRLYRVASLQNIDGNFVTGYTCVILCVCVCTGVCVWVCVWECVGGEGGGGIKDALYWGLSGCLIVCIRVGNISYFGKFHRYIHTYFRVVYLISMFNL